MRREARFNQLYEVAAAQQGLFTTRQAADAGYSPQLLIHHCHANRMARVQRGIYRLVHFPSGEHSDLVAAWLWAEQAAVLSHTTALALHGLSDVLPARIHLTLPEAWQSRRLRVPKSLVLHHAELSRADRTWFGAVPVTTVARTLNDCAKEGLSPELLQQAGGQALRRGLVRKAELRDVMRVLKPFGGLAV